MENEAEKSQRGMTDVQKEKQDQKASERNTETEILTPGGNSPNPQ